MFSIFPIESWDWLSHDLALPLAVRKMLLTVLGAFSPFHSSANVCTICVPTTTLSRSSYVSVLRHRGYTFQA